MTDPNRGETVMQRRSFLGQHWEVDALALSFLTALIAAVGQQNYCCGERPRFGDSNGTDHKTEPAWSDLDRRKIDVQRDLNRKSVENWEGHYSDGRSFFSSSWLISKNAGYVSTSKLLDMGKVVYTGAGIRLESDYQSPDGHRWKVDLIPIQWGDRRYFVQDDSLVHFCNWANSGHFQREAHAGAHCYLKRGDEDRPVRSLPSVPPDYRKYLLAKPLHTKIIRVLGKRVNVLVVGELQRETGILVTVDIGKAAGLLPGMKLYPTSAAFDWGEMSVISADAKTSDVLIYGLRSPAKWISVGLPLTTEFPS
jgi:hypothetical protein